MAHSQRNGAAATHLRFTLASRRIVDLSDGGKPGRRSPLSSSGGSGNTGGESFRADLGARLGVKMLTKSPIWSPCAVDAVPVCIRCEAIEPVDDLVVLTQRGRLLFQAKGDEKLHLPVDATKLMAPLDNPFVKAMSQLVTQQFSTGGRHIPLDPTSDRFVLAYKDATDDFKRLRRIGTRLESPASIPQVEARARLEVLRTDEEQRTFDRFVHVVRSLCTFAPTWEDITGLLRLTIFWQVPETISHRIDVDPGNQLREVLADGESCENAIDVMSSKIIALASVGAGIDASSLRSFMGQRFRLHAAPDCARDVQRVIAATETSVLAMTRLQRPVFGAAVDRAVVPTLIEGMELGPTVLVGERGVGKSAVVIALYEALRRQNAHVVVVDLKQATAHGMLTTPTAPTLSNSLAAVLASFPDPRPAYMLIDGLEETAADRQFEKAVLSLFNAVAFDRARWRLLATCRPFVLQGRAEWRVPFEGLPLKGAVEGIFASLRHVRLERFTMEELKQALAEAPEELRSHILSDASGRSFLALPEMLALLRDLPPGTQTPALYAKALLDVYWDRRVGSPDRQSVLIQLARAYRTNPSNTVSVGDPRWTGAAFTELCNEGVILVIRDRIHFAHESLAEYIHVRFPDG
jgi:hypothetical protein